MASVLWSESSLVPMIRGLSFHTQLNLHNDHNQLINILIFGKFWNAVLLRWWEKLTGTDRTLQKISSKYGENAERTKVFT